jgi:hypothetical protein
MPLRVALHTLLASLAALALAFAWQAVAEGEGAAATAASLLAVLGAEG